ncbi:MAG TPA: protein kinase [Candidatus Krumholzibacteria bacterium]|nr:protein kinase [Candidatus Krumholzibacteria bacterium]
MTLNSGTKLGPYEILSPLGAGGMGEVYRARDTRLGRDVAIKVLPQHLSSNPEVRARFEREAKTVSSLNHPHICTLFDVGRDGNTDYLVMELIEGETLATRLAKGALPLADTLRIGGEIADALDRAHRAGIVHRDLKPGNIMLTRSGAKLMDFGLARASGLAPAPGSGTLGALTQSPTVAHPLTAEGTIVGTFQYMSPEQLEGKEADASSDVWALGCVLYEMATGKRAFEGKSQASLITSIMGSEPAPISQVAPMTPPALDRLVQGMLAKDPRDRVQSAHDVKLQLAWIAEGGSGAGIPKVVAKSRRSRERLAWSIATVLMLVSAALLGRQLTMKYTPPAQVTRTMIPAPPATRLQITGDDSGPPAISPDGTMLVFDAVGGGGGKRLWLRRLDDLAARPLLGTDGASYPFWSPDNKSIAFFTFSKLRRLDLATGSVVTLVDGIESARGGSWSKDGVIIYTPTYASGLFRVSDSGGTPQAATTLDTTVTTTNRFPQFLPDGRHFIYLGASHHPNGPASAIYCASLDDGKAVRLIESKSSAIYANGFLLFVRDSTLMAQEFDAGSRTTRGEPRGTHEAMQLDGSTWNSPVSASNNGVLVYGLGGTSGTNRAALYDRSGRRIRNISPVGNILSVNASPDFHRIAFEWQQQPLADIWVSEVATGTRSRVTQNPDDDNSPVWLPDGNNVLYTGRDHMRYRIYQARVDGLNERKLVLEDPAHDVWPLDVTDDGRRLLYGVGRANGNRPVGALWIRSLTGDPLPHMLVPEAENFFGARFSPDGKWIVFDAEVSGHSDVYVSPVPAPGEGLSARWQVSTAGGTRPRWRGDSREIYYNRADGMVMAVPVQAEGNVLHASGEQSLFQAFQRVDGQTMEASPDGQSFIINTLGGDEAEPLAVVTNWLQTLKVK